MRICRIGRPGGACCGGTTGSGAPRYTSFGGGKNPIWNLYGHERMGWLLSLYGPTSAL